MPGILYLIPTPIGNLDDLTIRGLNTLKSVDVIAAEDTRHSGRLLTHYGIKKQLVSYHEHNEHTKIAQIIQHLHSGLNVALISDAGTPTLSDPGFKLVREALTQNIVVDSLPGASSILVALTSSGLPTDSFYFGGFLPKSNTKRQKAFAELKSLRSTLIFFESPYRLSSMLDDAHQVLGNRQIAIARELTKMHQEIVRTTIAEATKDFANKKIKGEIVVVIDRNPII